METFIIVLIVILVAIYVYQKTYFENFASSEPVKVIVFTSGHCPHCVTYKKNTEPQIIQYANSKGYMYENKDASHPDAQKLNVNYVPQAVVYKGSKHKSLEGSITSNNIESTLKSM